MVRGCLSSATGFIKHTNALDCSSAACSQKTFFVVYNLVSPREDRQRVWHRRRTTTSRLYTYAVLVTGRRVFAACRAAGVRCARVVVASTALTTSAGRFVAFQPHRPARRQTSSQQVLHGFSRGLTNTWISQPSVCSYNEGLQQPGLRPNLVRRPTGSLARKWNPLDPLEMANTNRRHRPTCDRE